MRLNVSAWSIRRPIPAVVAFAVLTILGLVSFRTMSITRFPNIDIPIVRVLITQSGAAPSELESQVTKKVEDAVSSVNGVWHIVSMVTDGSSSTIIQFTVGSVDIDRALNDVKDQIAKIRTDLPRTIDEPVISRIDIEGLPIVTYAASAPGLSVEQLSWFIDNSVARDLQSIHGVGEVERFGGVDREIRVALDPEKLLALGVTAATVNEQVRADNVDLWRRTRRARRPRAGDPHARWRAKARRSRRAADRAPGRAQGPARRTRDRHRRRRRAAHLHAPVRRADRRLRRDPRQGRERRDGRRADREAAQEHSGRAS